MQYISATSGKQARFESRKWSRFNRATTPDTESSSSGSSNNKQQQQQQQQQPQLSTKSGGKTAGGGSGAGGKHAKTNVIHDGQEASAHHLAENWIECWQTKGASIYFNFAYYPCPLIDWTRTRMSFNSCHFFLFLLQVIIEIKNK